MLCNEAARWREVVAIIAMAPAEQMPKVGQRLALGWHPAELAQQKPPDDPPVADRKRRRQSDDDIGRLKTRSEPLVIHALNDPAVTGDDGGQLAVAFRGVSANAVM